MPHVFSSPHCLRSVHCSPRWRSPATSSDGWHGTPVGQLRRVRLRGAGRPSRAVAAFALRQGSKEERGVLYAGLVVLGASLVFTVYGGRTWGDRPQPSITVTPKRGAGVSVSVRGTGLRSSEHIVVEVEQLLRVTDGQGRHTWRPGPPLYGASVGPDGAGEIEQTVDLPVPAGDFDDLGARAWVGNELQPCYTRGNTTHRLRSRASSASSGTTTALGRLGDLRAYPSTAHPPQGP